MKELLEEYVARMLVFIIYAVLVGGLAGWFVLADLIGTGKVQLPF